jgi:predicted small lipoprotein YifL
MQDYCNNCAGNIQVSRQAMKATYIMKIISMLLLVSACALAACGKTGPLYLPDDSPPESAKPQ